ncbi:tRNA pseudouridine synthase 1 [Boothiomyces sp. JEL0838]|nr:tRNA pseudouridine synthase 1 [Boothiomyces sp. JEL0838]
MKRKNHKQKDFPAKQPKLDEPIAEHLVALSLKPVECGALSETENLEYEKKYINSQRRNRTLEEDRGPREPNPSSTRKPKKKVALLMSYAGTGYHGMQINPLSSSIELDLHKALAAAGAVSQDNAMDPTKSSFVRCARTDKGVHAAGNVVSLKMSLDDGIIGMINEKLPPQIRVWGWSRVPNKFSAKVMCDSRIYEYLLPTYCLKDVDSSFYPHSNVALNANFDISKLDRKLNEPQELPPIDKHHLEKLQSYRAPSEKLAELKEILAEYKGTKLYHNFTVGKTSKDKSVKRYIIDFQCGEPFVRDGIEWVSCKVLGQAFMLHQIRKMIGLAILMVRSGTKKDLIPHCFGEERMNIPKAPALGLLLERPVFDHYNEKEGTKEDRDVIDFTPFQKEINEFKERWIYKAISDTEKNEGQFADWLRLVDQCSDDYSWFLNTKSCFDLGLQPENLFKKGTKANDEEELVDEDGEE